MKKIVLCLMATFMSLTFIPLQVNAATSDPASSLPAPAPATPAEATKTLTLESRLKEINAMDKRELNAADKKDLRKEAKSTRNELRTIGGGVYLSAGAVILILVILIIIL